MKNQTLRIIIVLVASLFLNIEAANAGLTHKINLYIRHGLSDPQWYLMVFGIFAFAFLAYVVAAPVAIGKQKSPWLNYYSYQPGKNSYQSKRNMVKKIATILQEETKRFA